MSGIPHPRLPPLPPPVGAGVRPSADAGGPQPPPPTSQPVPVAVTGPEPVEPDRYAPPDWLAAQRGLDKSREVSAKGIVLGIVAVLGIFVLSAVILAIMVASGDDNRVVERPFGDEIVESMPADPAAPRESGSVRFR